MKNLNATCKGRKNNYVLKHNYNYGTAVDNEDSVINKIILRDEQDLKCYIQDLLSNILADVKIKNNILTNYNSKSVSEINVELI